MTTNELILENLSAYLPREFILQLEMILGTKGSIVMCLAITDITREFNSDPETESKVEKLLEALCKNHFNA